MVTRDAAMAHTITHETFNYSKLSFCMLVYQNCCDYKEYIIINYSFSVIING